ncbi:FAD-dependent monooxygenase [Nonomuraea sp. B10E15]|uniref:FAD-dependent monooxygenase n=1 Tax=Nonomuraea sp. B10E15 TaxID=3153560 RepID=UPI00325CB1C7
MTVHDTQVLVVGAGPTGLTAAIELLRHGVECVLIDERDEPARYSRALVLQARSLELLHLHGLSDAIVRDGYLAPGFNFGADDRTPAMVEMYHSGSRYPFMLTLSQEETERTLTARLHELGGSVTREARLVSAAQERDAVFATVTGPAGEQSTLRARYLIDCSGSHSVLSGAYGTTKHSTLFDGTALIADVLVEGDLPRGFVSLHTNERGGLALLPFQNEYVRVIAFDLTKMGISHREPLELADVQETVDAIVPYPLRIREPKWITRFRAQDRLLPSYRDRRIFFAGDAAHLYIPVAAQGMNTGIQDAFNLAWKLAYVCRGRAPESLLDSYNDERHTIGERTRKLSDMLFRLFINQARSAVYRKVSSKMLGLALATIPVQNLMSGRVTQTGVNYRHTTLSKAQRLPRPARGAINAGDRVPDLDLADGGGPGVRLYDLLRESGYLLVGYASSYTSETMRTAMLAELSRLQDRYAGSLRCFMVLGEGLPGSGEVPTLLDARRELLHRFGAKPGDVFLIRPDGYLAFRTSDPGSLPPLLGSWLRPAEAELASA